MTKTQIDAACAAFVGSGWKHMTEAGRDTYREAMVRALAAAAQA